MEKNVGEKITIVLDNYHRGYDNSREEVTVQKVISREMFSWILARICEGIEQIRGIKENEYVDLVKTRK